MNTYNSYAHEIISKLAQKQEMVLNDQLNELISRGLIVVETLQPVMTQRFDEISNSYKVEVSAAVRLVPKEFEYIKKLEEENRELRETIKKIKEFV